MASVTSERAMSVSAASARGVSRLVQDASHGADIVVERHGVPLAVIVSVNRLQQLSRLESDLRSAALVLSRALTDTGARVELDTVIAELGFDRAELEAELDAELRTGHEPRPG